MNHEEGPVISKTYSEVDKSIQPRVKHLIALETGKNIHQNRTSNSVLELNSSTKWQLSALIKDNGRWIFVRIGGWVSRVEM